MLVMTAFAVPPACKERGSSKALTAPKRYDHLQIILYSPYTCYNEIQLDHAGLGINILGYHYPDSTSKIKTRKDFQLAPAAQKKIQELVTGIQSRPLITSGYAEDKYRYVVTIDNKKFIDRFGQDSLLTTMLKAVAPYIHNEESGQCDFFYLFNQVGK